MLTLDTPFFVLRPDERHSIACALNDSGRTVEHALVTPGTLGLVNDKLQHMGSSVYSRIRIATLGGEYTQPAPGRKTGASH
jgi:hypothetical protein